MKIKAAINQNIKYMYKLERACPVNHNTGRKLQQASAVNHSTGRKLKRASAVNYNTEPIPNPVGSSKTQAKTPPNPRNPPKPTRNPRPNPPPMPSLLPMFSKVEGATPFGLYKTKQATLGWGPGLCPHPLPRAPCLVLYPGFPPE